MTLVSGLILPARSTVHAFTVPLVCGIALHTMIVGQPYRLRELRRALRHVVDDGRAWVTLPGMKASLERE